MENLSYKIKGLNAVCKYQAHFNKEFDILHILDRDIPETITVTNSVSKSFIKYTLEQMLIKKTPGAVWLYGTDGIVSSFDLNTSKFKFISKDIVKQKGYKNFNYEMKNRKIKF